jgi:hypothetical protein
MTARVLTRSAAIVLAILSGCGTPSVNAPLPVVNSAVVGKWVVAAINGKPVASGTEIHVEYLPDGRVTVETTGDATAVPDLDREELKRALDQVAGQGAKPLNSLKITVGDSELQLKWNGGAREVPAAPVPPK